MLFTGLLCGFLLGFVMQRGRFCITGAFLFGIGIIYAGGCATGTWYRAGEGLIGSWVALVIYGLFSASMRTGVLAPLNQELKSNVIQHRTIYETFGISPWVLVFILSVITLALSAHSI
ncbi:TPA: YeeE/YedE family protein [Mannheimia haemolytica]|nr:YeeE/YedE family protein [Mannheimia haemolytica]